MYVAFVPADRLRNGPVSILFGKGKDKGQPTPDDRSRAGSTLESRWDTAEGALRCCCRSDGGVARVFQLYRQHARANVQQ